MPSLTPPPPHPCHPTLPHPILSPAAARQAQLIPLHLPDSPITPPTQTARTLPPHPLGPLPAAGSSAPRAPPGTERSPCSSGPPAAAGRAPVPAAPPAPPPLPPLPPPLPPPPASAPRCADTTQRAGGTPAPVGAVKAAAAAPWAAPASRGGGSRRGSPALGTPTCQGRASWLCRGSKPRRIQAVFQGPAREGGQGQQPGSRTAAGGRGSSRGQEQQQGAGTAAGAKDSRRGQGPRGGGQQEAVSSGRPGRAQIGGRSSSYRAQSRLWRPGGGTSGRYPPSRQVEGRAGRWQVEGASRQVAGGGASRWAGGAMHGGGSQGRPGQAARDDPGRQPGTARAGGGGREAATCAELVAEPRQQVVEGRLGHGGAAARLCTAAAGGAAAEHTSPWWGGLGRRGRRCCCHLAGRARGWPARAPTGTGPGTQQAEERSSDP